MRSHRNVMLAATLAGLVVSGFFLVPGMRPRLRRLLAEQARAKKDWLDGSLRNVEEQLASLEAQIHSAGLQLNRRLHDVVGHYVPEFAEGPAGWSIDDREVARDLPHMPGR